MKMTQKEVYSQLNAVNSVYLTIDATKSRLAAKAFAGCPLGLQAKSSQSLFLLLPLWYNFCESMRPRLLLE